MSDGRLPCCRNVRIVSRYFATRLAVLQRTLRPCVPTGVVLLCWRRMPFAGHYPCIPIFRYSSCCTTTDAQTERPYRSRIALLETDSLRWTLPVHSDISLLVSLYYDGRSDRASLQESYCFAGDGRPSLDTIVCPYISLLVLLYYNGRTDRASLQESYYSDTMDALLQNSIGVIGVDQKCRR